MNGRREGGGKDWDWPLLCLESYRYMVELILRLRLPSLWICHNSLGNDISEYPRCFVHKANKRFPVYRLKRQLHTQSPPVQSLHVHFIHAHVCPGPTQECWRQWVLVTSSQEPKVGEKQHLSCFYFYYFGLCELGPPHSLACSPGETAGSLKTRRLLIFPLGALPFFSSSRKHSSLFIVPCPRAHDGNKSPGKLSVAALACNHSSG